MLPHNTHAQKLTINLPNKAKQLDLDLPAKLEQMFTESSDINKKLWRKQNQSAIADYNIQVDEQGVFSDGMRNF